MRKIVSGGFVLSCSDPEPVDLKLTQVVRRFLLCEFRAGDGA
jgi:hypothetical protein